MGTRHLIKVKINKEYKIAQYGQWDGYIEGQGVKIFDFLSNKEKVEKLKQNLSKCRFFDAEGKDKKFIKDYNKSTPKWSNEPDNRTDKYKNWFESYITRDLGADILESVAYSEEDDEILLEDSLDFEEDTTFCEYCYEIDFDTNTLIIDGYRRKRLGVFNINELPSKEEFLKLKEKDIE